MPSSVIGALRVTLGLDSAEFSRGATAAEKRAEALGYRIGRSMKLSALEVARFTSAFAGLGAIAGSAALSKLASDGLDYASSLGEVAQQLGVTTRDLQVYRYAASQVGIEQEEIDRSLAKLTLTMGKAREGAKGPLAVFRQLGAAIGTDILANAQTAGDAIPLIAEALGKIPDPASRAAIEVELFGKAGQKLDTLLAGGAAGVNGLRDAAHSLGIVLSDEQIKNADDTADKLSELKQVLGANIAGAVADNAKSIYLLADSLVQVAAAAVQAFGSLRNNQNLDVLNHPNFYRLTARVQGKSPQAQRDGAFRGLLDNKSGRQQLFERNRQQRLALAPVRRATLAPTAVASPTIPRPLRPNVGA